LGPNWGPIGKPKRPSGWKLHLMSFAYQLGPNRRSAGKANRQLGHAVFQLEFEFGFGIWKKNFFFLKPSKTIPNISWNPGLENATRPVWTFFKSLPMFFYNTNWENERKAISILLEN